MYVLVLGRFLLRSKMDLEKMLSFFSKSLWLRALMAFATAAYLIGLFCTSGSLFGNSLSIQVVFA